MPINVYPAPLEPQNVFVTSSLIQTTNSLVYEAKTKKSKMTQFLAALNTL